MEDVQLTFVHRLAKKPLLFELRRIWLDALQTAVEGGK